MPNVLEKALRTATLLALLLFFTTGSISAPPEGGKDAPVEERVKGIIKDMSSEEVMLIFPPQSGTLSKPLHINWKGIQINDINWLVYAVNETTGIAVPLARAEVIGEVPEFPGFVAQVNRVADIPFLFQLSAKPNMKVSVETNGNPDFMRKWAVAVARRQAKWDAEQRTKK